MVMLKTVRNPPKHKKKKKGTVYNSFLFICGRPTNWQKQDTGFTFDSKITSVAPVNCRNTADFSKMLINVSFDIIKSEDVCGLTDNIPVYPDFLTFLLTF